jgi:hypothetical protein
MPPTRAILMLDTGYWIRPPTRIRVKGLRVKG